jgi:hypothetical protein
MEASNLVTNLWIILIIFYNGIGWQFDVNFGAYFNHLSQ